LERRTNKTTAKILLESLIAKGERLVTDAEVLQKSFTATPLSTAGMRLIPRFS